jgi:molybdopterin synthase catalytic subunit
VREFAVEREPIQAERLRGMVAAGGAGAVVVFHGTVRDNTRGRRVLFLEYEAYPEMAVEVLERIGTEVANARGLLDIACAHRIGRVDVGEDAVVVAASAPHRAAALAAIEDFVARLKREVPIWKKEHFEDGAVWVGTPDDPQGEKAGAA